MIHKPSWFVGILCRTAVAYGPYHDTPRWMAQVPPDSASHGATGVVQGEKKRCTEPMPNGCSTTYSGAPTTANITVAYDDFGAGSYLYCNNPEQLRSTSYFGDSNLGNKYLLWEYVTGSCQTWYEHLNNSGSTIGYGVQIYNPNTTAITVEVTNIGFGTDPTTPWTQFYSGASGGGGTVGTFTVQAGQVLWIQRNDSAIPNSTVFNGVVHFNISGGSAYVFWYAYENFSNINGTASYLGWVQSEDPQPDPQNEARVYKGLLLQQGTSNQGTFFTTGNFSYNVSQLLASPATWLSNECGDGNNDMQDVQIPTGSPGSPAFTTVSCLDSPAANLGNWGIQYDYHLSITNDTSTDYTIHLLVSQLRSNAASNVIVDTPDGSGGCAVGPASGNSDTWDFYDFTLAAGASTTVEWQVVLGASSSGGLTQSIIVS